VDQTFKIRTPLLSGRDASCGGGYSIVVLDTQEASPPHHCRRQLIMVVGLNREDVQWAKYYSNNACVGDLVCWKAQRHPVANWPFE